MVEKGGGMINASAVQWKKSLQNSDLLVKHALEPEILREEL